MILVTGATGHLGNSTINFLLQKIAPNNIAALARDTSKAADLAAKGIDVRVGDYNDYDSLVNAFKGVNKLFLISSSDTQNRSAQQQNAVKAAKEAGVQHIVYTGVDMKDFVNSAIAQISLSHAETISLIKSTGIPYTILNNTLYADVLPMFLGESVLETGVFYPTGDGKVPFATRTDMAEAAANVLTGTGHESKEYAISNNTKYTLADVASTLSELSGKQVAYVSPAADVYQQQLLAAGVPEMYVGMFAAFAEAIKQNEFDTATTDLEALLGRKPTTLKEYLQAVYFSGSATN